MDVCAFIFVMVIGTKTHARKLEIIFFGGLQPLLFILKPRLAEKHFRLTRLGFSCFKTNQSALLGRM